MEVKQSLETVQSENERLKRKNLELEEKCKKNLNQSLLKEIV